ncbi:MAG: MBL fold metallo-hydrolase [Anaerolineae bacterium]|jgi:ribonuclease Z|nr:MBL fold metallo-hydrolase [Anaerolineae bacterium]MBT7073143.1 MBL fold metallo-hydrolase [Anaerolineae bacterium]MBT7326631.1 MBL fold metallo-hydrolase [Anaerolineae bacterium]
MAKIIILGSSNAIADENHENAHLICVGKTRTVLVDSSRNPILRLRDIGIEFEQITDLILTHFHPDHISGIPLFLMDMWLRGRKSPLEIYGLPHTIERMENLMDAFSWKNWPNFFPVTFNKLPSVALNPVIDCTDFKIYSSPVCHMIPTIGMRIEFNEAKKVVAYSCDTEPCDEVVHLGKNADILIHEASGNFVGHSSSAQAAEIATQANAKRLYLIHYPTGEYWQENTLEDAQRNFDGDVVLAEDLMILNF